MRNIDVNASIYWLSRMLESGENPLFIDSRLVRFACEDVGLADNRVRSSFSGFVSEQYLSER
nr:hypothetical protein [Paenibacillus terrae]